MVKIVVIKVGTVLSLSLATWWWWVESGELVTDFLVFQQSGQLRSSLEGSHHHQCIFMRDVFSQPNSQDCSIILSFNSLLLNYQNLFTKDLIISLNSIQRPLLMWSFPGFCLSSRVSLRTEMFPTSSPGRQQNKLLCFISLKHRRVDVNIESYWLPDLVDCWC